MDSRTPENQCCAATVEEMCAATLGHYDDISMKACHWNNQVPQAIKFWYLEKPKLELALAAANERLRGVEEALSDAITHEDLDAAVFQANMDRQRADRAEKALRDIANGEVPLDDLCEFAEATLAGKP